MAAKKINVFPYCAEKHKDILKYIADNLRKEDLSELMAQGYINPKEVVELSLDTSEIALLVTGEHNEPLCAFGLSFIKDEHGTMIWCVGTHHLEKYKREFLVNSDYIIDEWKKRETKLYNYVSVKNIKAVRWLKWLGAKFSKPFLCGENEEFMLFVIEGKGENVYDSNGADRR